MVAERAQTEGATDDTYRQQFVKQWRTGWTALPHEVLFRDDLTMGDLKVYMALASFCWGGKRDCHPSRQLLMDMTGLSGKTISVAVAHLEGIDWVRCKRGKNRQDGNSYTLTGPLVPAAAGPFSPPEPCEETTYGHVKGLPMTSEETTHGHVNGLPIKQTNSETDKEKHTTADAVVEGDAPAPSAQSERSAELCRTLGVELTDINVRAMDAVVARWGERCESACTMSLEEKALDARAWLDTPAAKKKRRQPSVQYFRGWVAKDVKRADADAQAAPQPSSQNGHRATTGPTGGSDPPAASNPFLESMRRRQIARDAKVIADLVALGEKQP